jgi:membrane associated rhomboid family serine protease
MNNYIYIILMLMLTFSTHAYGYIGPSVGIGVLGAIVGVISSLFLAIFGILYYPIKRCIRNMRSKKNKKNGIE